MCITAHQTSSLELFYLSFSFYFVMSFQSSLTRFLRTFQCSFPQYTFDYYFKVPKWHFEMALNKVKQLVSVPHEFFYPINHYVVLLFCGISSCVFVIKKHGQMAL